ncbi:thioredoxin domain-containing protein 11-like [Dendronephthya gigantea]|uniref:thioredoxin domain-containing protein 11-like n=1 Tax=Dendronephthya gigantea TaxID=151771 RepID=UPI0010692D33|nr:thioredoxin domain-containing protein 11-like [Dendronephthya gigantea]
MSPRPQHVTVVMTMLTSYPVNHFLSASFVECGTVATFVVSVAKCVLARETRFRYETFSVLRSFALPRNSCRSLRKNSYQEKNALSVCCFDNKVPRLQDLVNFGKSSGVVSETGLSREEHLKILAERFQMLNKDIKSNPSKNDLGVFKNLLGNFMNIFKSPGEEDKGKLDNRFTQTFESKSPPGFNKSDQYPPEFGTCEYPGKIRVFAGASCYSNITVKFYYMNSRKYWNYAEAFGVKYHTAPRVALVIVDSQNEAQYVLPEETTLNNASVVNFLMNFTNGILSRRLRSAPVPNQPCFTTSGCLYEVVSKTFSKIVLDDEKDVFLMYYTSWCGFCKSVNHIIVSLVQHYKHSEHIRIARLNGDLNDLPWQYTSNSYPSFIFFPARRKDLSVKFPENQARTLENFIKFMETHKTGHVKIRQRYVTGSGHMRVHSLQRNLNYLKRQNTNLRRRLNSEIAAKENAKRQVDALLSERTAVELDYNAKLRKLSVENSKLLREILQAKKRLSKYRSIAQRTVEELKRRNWELHSTIVSLEEGNLLLSKETTEN